MRTIGITAAALALAAMTALAGCGAKGGGPTPEGTFRLYKSAMSDRNFEDVWGMLSAASQERMNQDAAVLSAQAEKAEGPGRKALDDTARLIGMTLEQMTKMDGRTFFVGLLKMAAETGREDMDKLARAEISRVETQGQSAQVFIKADGVEQTDRPMPLVKEGGRWKVDLVGAAASLPPLKGLDVPKIPVPEAPHETP